jgi:hypothetical protein
MASFDEQRRIVHSGSVLPDSRQRCCSAGRSSESGRRDARLPRVKRGLGGFATHRSGRETTQATTGDDTVLRPASGERRESETTARGVGDEPERTNTVRPEPVARFIGKLKCDRERCRNAHAPICLKGRSRRHVQFDRMPRVYARLRTSPISSHLQSELGRS